MHMKNEKQKPGLIVTGLVLGLLLSSLDQTILSTAMPTVVRNLGGLSLYSWAFTMYMLTSTISIPVAGKLADLYGRRRIYMVGMGLFLLGSALCGMAQDMTQLILFRGLQGLGGGALLPVAMTIVGDIFPPEKIGKFQGLLAAVIGLSSIVGPALGGFIVEHFSWRWVFYVNLPFGIAAMMIMWVALRETGKREKRSVDWWGTVTLSLSVIAFMLAIVSGSDRDSSFTTTGITLLYITGAVLLGAFLVIETRTPEPIIPLTLFRNRVITVSSLVGFFTSIGMFAALAYIPLFVQGIIGVSPSVSGYILTPMMLSLIVASILSGRFISKVQFRILLVTGLAIMITGYWLFAQMNISTTKGAVVMNMIIFGLGFGVLLPVLTSSTQIAVEKEHRGVATSLVQFFRFIGGPIGVSIMGAAMNHSLTEKMTRLSSTLPPEKLQQLSNPNLLMNSDAKAALPHELLVAIQNVFVEAIQPVFYIGIGFIAVGFVIAFFMGKSRYVKKDDEATAAPVEHAL